MKKTEIQEHLKGHPDCVFIGTQYGATFQVVEIPETGSEVFITRVNHRWSDDEQKFVTTTGSRDLMSTRKIGWSQDESVEAFKKRMEENHELRLAGIAKREANTMVMLKAWPDIYQFTTKHNISTHQRHGSTAVEMVFTADNVALLLDMINAVEGK
jgi:hypothetical protein